MMTVSSPTFDLAIMLAFGVGALIGGVLVFFILQASDAE